MKFEKGNNYGKGRPKGSKNIATSEIRKTFLKLLNDNLDGLQEDINSLEPKDKVKMLLELASFCIPKLKAVELTNEQQNNAPNRVELTTEEIRRIHNVLEEKY